MQIEKLDRPIKADQDEKLENQYIHLQALLEELRSRDIPEAIAVEINEKIVQVNAFSGSIKEMKKKIRGAKSAILKLIEKELKLVPRAYYRNQWMVLGMTVFGLPFGVIFGMSLDNFAFLGIGLPIGMAIGIAVGSSMDEKAHKEGRQLEVELGH